MLAISFIKKNNKKSKHRDEHLVAIRAHYSHRLSEDTRMYKDTLHVSATEEGLWEKLDPTSVAFVALNKMNISQRSSFFIHFVYFLSLYGIHRV